MNWNLFKYYLLQCDDERIQVKAITETIKKNL